MKKPKFLSKLVGTAIKGFPLINTIKNAIVKREINTNEGPIIVPPTKVDLEWVIKFLAEAGAVWLAAYLMNKYGITLEDIKNLWGLFGK